MIEEGRVAIVTGGGRGIGRAVALRLAKEGADVAISYRSNDEAAEKAAEEVRTAGMRCETFRGDVALQKDVEALFSGLGVLTPVELKSRFDVYAEQYIQSIAVESRVVVDMAKTLIYPAAMECLADLSATFASLAALKVTPDTSVVKTVTGLCDRLLSTVGKLSTAMGHEHFDTIELHLKHCAHVIRPLMDEVRTYVDALEGEIGDKYWPLPTYEELLFIK